MFYPMKSKRTVVALSVATAAIIAAVAFFMLSGPPTKSAATALPQTSRDAVAAAQVIPIDVASLQTLMAIDPNLVIIDVRKAAELSGPLGFIPQSQNIPMKALTRSLDSLPRGKTLVFICHSGPRSLKAARKAADHGLTSYFVKGGMVAWRQMTRSKGKENPPVAPPPSAPQETPFFGRDMGC
jgi:rhodanese-related sulfurtransferase